MSPLRWWAQTLGAAALAAFLTTSFVVRPFRIPTESMEDTLKVGDRVLVWTSAYGLRLPGTHRRLPALAPKKGDLLVFAFPSDDPAEVHCTGLQKGKLWLKRVVAVPGETVALSSGALTVGGSVPSEPFMKRTAAAPCAMPPVRPTPEEYQRLWEARRVDIEVGDGVRDHFGPVTVPPGAAFVLGDNRDASCDSRFWGPVWDRYAVGRAVFVYWPPSRIGLVR